MSFRFTLVLASAALLLGSLLLLVEGSDLISAIGAAHRREPLLLPESLLLGTAAFFGAFSISAAAILWPIIGRMDQGLPAPAWTRWAGLLVAALGISSLAAAFMPGLLPVWLSAQGYEPCEAFDATRWIRTRHSQGEIQQHGWALPQDCVSTDLTR
jgi:hypothetical protein